MTDRPHRRVAVIFGGRSAEHEVSVASAQSVLAALDPARYDVVTIGIDKQGRWHRLDALPGPGGTTEGLPAIGIDDGPEVALARRPGEAALVAEDGTRQRIDVVFPVLHGPFGEDGTIQGMLELAGVPYVGSGVLGSALGIDKAVQKVLFTAWGLPVAPFEVVHERDWQRDRESVEARATSLGLPLFIKPATLGSSVGITKVKQPDEFRPAVEVALSYARKAVVERSVELPRRLVWRSPPTCPVRSRERSGGWRWRPSRPSRRPAWPGSTSSSALRRRSW